MFNMSHIIVWASLVCFNSYAVLPVYVVHASGGDTGQLPRLSSKRSTLANRTFCVPGIEELDGDFHHHDSTGNDLILVEKKSALHRASLECKPFLCIHTQLLPCCGKTSLAFVETNHLPFEQKLKHRINDGYRCCKSVHSPPSHLS